MKRTAQKLNVLFQISQRMMVSYNLSELLDFILYKSVKVFKARTGSLMLIEKRSRRLIIRSQVGLKPEYQKRLKLKVGQGVTGRCASLGQPILVRDTSKEKDYIEVVVGTRSELAVPMLFAGQVLGVINLDSDRVEAFTKQDMKLLTTFAGWASVAIYLKMSEKN